MMPTNGEPDVVEATIIEPCAELTYDKPTVPAIVSNIDQVAADVARQLKEFQAFEVNDEASYKASKAQRTAVRKIKQPIDAARKQLKAAYVAPFEAFEAKVKAVTSQVDELDAAYKSANDAYEATWRENRRKSLEDFYAEYAPALAEMVDFGKLLDASWLNRGTQQATAEQGIIDACDRIAADEKSIDNLDMTDQERVKVKAEYFRTLDIGAALKSITEAREKAEQVRRLEESRKPINRDRFKATLSPDEMEQVKDETEGKQTNVSPASALPSMAYVMTFMATTPQLTTLKQTLASNGIHGVVSPIGSATDEQLKSARRAACLSVGVERS
jgi:hypothetical protein